MTIDELKQTVGLPYKQLDPNGKALGCMMPVYLLYPEIPSYDWPTQDEFVICVLDLLKKHGREVPIEEMKPGDVIAYHLPLHGSVHIGVYLGNDEMIHCITGETMEIVRLFHVVKRIKGVFRWEHHFGEQ